MKKNREQILSADDFARLRAMDPSKPEKSLPAVSRSVKPLRSSTGLRPVEIQTWAEPIKLKFTDTSDEFKSLKKAVSNPKLFEGRRTIGAGVPKGSRLTLVMEGNKSLLKHQWVKLAWLEKYQNFKIRIWWVKKQGVGDDEFHTIKNYILVRNIPFESEQMLRWWDELIVVVPKEINAGTKFC